MKHFRRLGVFFCLTLPALLMLSGCGNDPKGISQGIIEYKAEAVDPNSPMASIAPSKMTVKFKNDYSSAEMAAGWGMANMVFVSDPVKHEFTSMVNLIGQKYYSNMAMDSIKYYNYFLPEYDVDYSNDSKIIAGYTCRKATLKFKNGQPPMVVYYTTEIKFKNPNWSNAFYKIDGVLMEYQLKKFGLELKFTANSVSAANIDDEIFKLQSGYKKITNYQLELMFKELQ